ncbi:MAG: hypothetical protein U1A78_16200 [Polyangia bacterium]
MQLLQRANRRVRALCAAVGAVFVLGAAGPARGEALFAPLAEMRAAAEALAEVEPEPVPPRAADAVHAAGAGAPAGSAAQGAMPAARASEREALHAAVRAAVHDELRGELRGGRGLAPGAAALLRHGRDGAGHASEAATQAQQARLGRDLAQERGRAQGTPLASAPTPAAGRAR